MQASRPLRVGPPNVSAGPNELGTIEVGRLADLIAGAGDPLRDITLLQKAERIKLVWKGGTIHVDRRITREVAVEA